MHPFEPRVDIPSLLKESALVDVPYNIAGLLQATRSYELSKLTIVLKSFVESRTSLPIPTVIC